MEACGTFTTYLWNSTEDIYKNILQSDFVTGIAAGTLSESSFNHYLAQDVLYIAHDTTAFKKVSERAYNTDEKEFFKQMSEDCMEIENALHDDFIKHFNTQAATSQSKAFKDYCDFLDNCIWNDEYPVAVAALLPCFWVYGKAGMHIINTAVPDNKYQMFIDTYSGDDYTEYCRKFIEITERLAENASPQTQEKMQKAFVQSTLHELAVFEESGEKSSLSNTLHT